MTRRPTLAALVVVLGLTSLAGGERPGLVKAIDTYWGFPSEKAQPACLWNARALAPGKHTVRFVVTGEKHPDAVGTRIYVASATVYTSTTAW